MAFQLPSNQQQMDALDTIRKRRMQQLQGTGPLPEFQQARANQKALINTQRTEQLGALKRRFAAGQAPEGARFKLENQVNAQANQQEQAGRSAIDIAEAQQRDVAGDKLQQQALQERATNLQEGIARADIDFRTKEFQQNAANNFISTALGLKDAKLKPGQLEAAVGILTNLGVGFDAEGNPDFNASNLTREGRVFADVPGLNILKKGFK